MKSNQFFVSVIIPVYNGETFLSQAVESIQRQDYEPLEIIIVDDGSTDNTARIATGFKGNIRYKCQPNSGTPSARNKGLEMACGNVICFLDADDLWGDNKLERQLAYLAKDSSLEIVLGYTQCILPSGAGEGNPKFEKYLNAWPALSLGGATFRKSAFDKVGFFNQQLPYNDDVDWFLRAKELGISMVIHHEVTQFYRRHNRNMTNHKDLNQSHFVAAIKKSLDRRRKTGNGVIKPITKWLESGE